MNFIMNFSAFVFGILFLFILFLFITTILAFFSKQRKVTYEPKVSILIPAYNEEKNIGKCLTSILNSKYPKNKMEVIVIDDGSTDNTQKIIKGFSKKFKNVKLIKGNHEGKSEALNSGVKKSSYDIIMSVDADTIVNKDAVKKLVTPFFYKNVGATNGSCLVKNKNSILGIFQNIEYHYNNLIRRSFSELFRNGIWFFGAFACYRKEILKEIGYFKRDTLTEDMDIALEIYSKNYKIINVYDAIGFTVVPKTIMALVKQRTRWWVGVLQSLNKNNHLFNAKSGPSIIFLFINQYWWSFFAIVSLPLIIYQFNYWLPYNISNFSDFFVYTFGWVSLFGSMRVIYKIPEWGLSVYSIFGVLSGILSSILIVSAIYLYKDKLNVNNIFAIFFYFPYTIVLNIIIFISIIKISFLKRKFFIS